VNLAERFDRFDQFVAAVRQRLRQAGEDPDVVLDVRRAQFILAALTVRQDPPLYYPADVRQVLQGSTTIDELADTFIDKWRTQRGIDESIEPIPDVRGEPRRRDLPPETFGHA
jgi:hypothetical protein